MSNQNLIIYKFSRLYHILEELSLDLNFNITFANSENSLNEKVKNLNNHLIISKKKSSDIGNQFILDNLPKCMNFIKIKGNLSEETMFDTFNMGIGFCIIIDKKNKDDIFNLFENEILELGYII